MKNIEELLKAALEYHLQQIEDQMQEAVNKGNLFIIYKIPKTLLEDPQFRDGLANALSQAGYRIAIYPSEANYFKISCIEIIDEDKQSSKLIELEPYQL